MIGICAPTPARHSKLPGELPAGSAQVLFTNEEIRILLKRVRPIRTPRALHRQHAHLETTHTRLILRAAQDGNQDTLWQCHTYCLRVQIGFDRAAGHPRETLVSCRRGTRLVLQHRNFRRTAVAPLPLIQHDTLRCYSRCHEQTLADDGDVLTAASDAGATG